MKYVIEIPDNKTLLAEEFLKAVTFIKNIRRVQANEITNPILLQSIEEYENGKIQATSFNLEELRQIIHNA